MLHICYIRCYKDEYIIDNIFTLNCRLLLDRPAQMVTASYGYSLHDTKHRIRRLDSVFHHLCMDEVMVPWSSDGDSSGDDQSTGFAVPYEENGTPELYPKPKFYLNDADDPDDSVFDNDNSCKYIDLPPRILPLFSPEDTIKGTVHVTVNGKLIQIVLNTKYIFLVNNWNIFLMHLR